MFSPEYFFIQHVIKMWFCSLCSRYPSAKVLNSFQWAQKFSLDFNFCIEVLNCNTKLFGSIYMDIAMKKQNSLYISSPYV